MVRIGQLNYLGWIICLKQLSSILYHLSSINLSSILYKSIIYFVSFAKNLQPPIMVLPIVAYGHPALRKVAKDIMPGHAGLEKLIEDMWETMYASNGVGLAAPQVNRDIRLFVVDTVQMFSSMDEDEAKKFPDAPGVKGVFINAHIVELNGEEWPYNEGCLSIPRIREDIYRHESVTLQFRDANFESHILHFTGLSARVILHEYDHIEGKLFIDHITPLKRKLMKGRLADISKGKVDVDYKMLFPG
jgi:peptide deformylase